MVLLDKAESGPPHRTKRQRPNPYRKRNTPYIAIIIIMGLCGLFLQFRYETEQAKERKQQVAPMIPCGTCKSTGLNPLHGFIMGHHSQSAFAQTTLLLNKFSEGYSVRDLTCPDCGGSGLLHRRASREQVIALFQRALAQQALANLVTRPATCRNCSGAGLLAPEPPWDYDASRICPDCSGTGFELLHDSTRVWEEVVGEPLSLEEVVRELESATGTRLADPDQPPVPPLPLAPAPPTP